MVNPPLLFLIKYCAIKYKHFNAKYSVNKKYYDSVVVGRLHQLALSEQLGGKKTR